MIRETGRPRWRKVSHRELRRLQAAQRRLTALHKRQARQQAKAAAAKWHETRRAKQGRAGILKDQRRDALGRVVPGAPRLTGHNAAVLMAMASDEWLSVTDIRRRSGRRTSVVTNVLYQRFERRGLVERALNADYNPAAGLECRFAGQSNPRYLWRLTHEGARLREACETVG